MNQWTLPGKPQGREEIGSDGRTYILSEGGKFDGWYCREMSDGTWEARSPSLTANLALRRQRGTNKPAASKHLHSEGK